MAPRNSSWGSHFFCSTFVVVVVVDVSASSCETRARAPTVCVLAIARANRLVHRERFSALCHGKRIRRPQFTLPRLTGAPVCRNPASATTDSPRPHPPTLCYISNRRTDTVHINLLSGRKKKLDPNLLHAVDEPSRSARCYY